MEKIERIILSCESDTEALAYQCAQLVVPGMTLYLHGDLGAGKTYFSRAMLQSLGVKGRIKSPTYTIVEPYFVEGLGDLFHFDFYRLSNVEEVEYLGLENYDQAYLSLIEWPNKAGAYLLKPDISFMFFYDDAGRRVSVEGMTKVGDIVVKALKEGGFL
jgi:tRNA threonylcarbamoyladenosine biosynthesis protein TsaE